MTNITVQHYPNGERRLYLGSVSVIDRGSMKTDDELVRELVYRVDQLSVTFPRDKPKESRARYEARDARFVPGTKWGVDWGYPEEVVEP